MKIINKINLLFCLVFSMYLSCMSKDSNITENKDDVATQELENNKETTPINTEQTKNKSEITESNPLIESDKYHAGFEKRKHSYLYNYEPQIRNELPRMYIYSSSGNTDFATLPTRVTKDNFEYEKCQVSIVNCEEKYAFSKVDASIKVRGNATASKVKKPFNLKFDNKINLLGLNNNNKFKSWVLNATFADESSLRDLTAYYLSKQIFGYDHLYSTDTTFVELYLNNTYWGLYLLQEKQQVNKNRVNIDDVEKRSPEGSYSGTDIGYYFEFDGYAKDEKNRGSTDPIFNISYNDYKYLKTYSKTQFKPLNTNFYLNKDGTGIAYTLHSNIYSNNQLKYITNYVDKVYIILYEAIYNKRYYVFDEEYNKLIERKDLNSYDVINKVVNIDSFVDKFILEEILCNPDLYWSQYFQVDMSLSGDKKLAFTSNWDYDAALVNNGHGEMTGYFTFQQYYTKVNRFNPWFHFLPHEKWFIDLVKAKWNQLVEHQVFYNALHYIDEFKINYSKYYKRDKERWNHTEDAEVQQNNLFNYLLNRLNNLNRIFHNGENLF